MSRWIRTKPNFTKNEGIVALVVIVAVVLLFPSAPGLMLGITVALGLNLVFQKQINSYRLKPGVVKWFGRVK